MTIGILRSRFHEAWSLRLGTSLEGWRAELAGVPLARPRQVLRLFAESPFWTVRGVAEELGVAYTTAQRAVERLRVAGIVSLVGSAKRNRVYCARDMLAVLEGPARRHGHTWKRFRRQREPYERHERSSPA